MTVTYIKAKVDAKAKVPIGILEHDMLIVLENIELMKGVATTPIRRLYQYHSGSIKL